MDEESGGRGVSLLSYVVASVFDLGLVLNAGTSLLGAGGRRIYLKADALPPTPFLVLIGLCRTSIGNILHNCVHHVSNIDSKWSNFVPNGPTHMVQKRSKRDPKGVPRGP